MLQVARWRVIVTILVTVFGLLFALPNALPESVRNALPGFLPSRTVSLGLDLRGGSQLLLEVDAATLRRQQLDGFADVMANALRQASPRITYGGRGVVGDAARIRITNAADVTRAMEAIRQDIPLSPSQGMRGGAPLYELTQGADGLIEARFAEGAIGVLSRDAVARSIEVVRRRIDPTGTSEVSITRQGDDRIVIQAPGVADPAQLRERVGQTALLTFHRVDDQADEAAVAEGRIPAASMIAQPYAQGTAPELVRRRPDLTGEHLQNAQARLDSQSGQWVISFQLDSVGARTFCRISTEYVGRRFAILLDNRVLTAPNIREPICAGSGQIDGSFTASSASELALLLRAGALPVPLTVIEQRSIGPEMGQAAIEAGAIAGLIAVAATLVFMVLAYGIFGLFACGALVINGILIVAAMSMIGATLTMPGIAGLILTIAMAVDANVLIYERMRDEQAAGRGPALAIDAGFGRAIITIMDANLTTILAAVILFWFGVGPVRGFAWTLSIGVITSVFTAVIVTQIFIAMWFRAARPKRLPI